MIALIILGFVLAFIAGWLRGGRDTVHRRITAYKAGHDAGYERGITEGAEAVQWAHEHAGELAEACEAFMGLREERVVKQRESAPWQ